MKIIYLSLSRKTYFHFIFYTPKSITLIVQQIVLIKRLYYFNCTPNLNRKYCAIVMQLLLPMNTIYVYGRIYESKIIGNMKLNAVHMHTRAYTFV